MGLRRERERANLFQSALQVLQEGGETVVHHVLAQEEGQVAQEGAQEKGGG